MYKQIRGEFPQVLQELRALLPETAFVINSGRPQHQQTDTQRQLERKLGSENPFSEMRFRPPDSTDEAQSKTATIQELLARDNAAGHSQSVVLAIDDNLTHALDFARVDPNRVFVYWVPEKNDLVKILTSDPRAMEKLPTNIKYISSLKIIPADVKQRLVS